MWKDLDYRQMEMEAGSFIKAPARSSKELEEIIIFARLSLYNSGENYGPVAIATWMNERLVKPIPSVSLISKTLKNNCLTNQRTGRY